MPEIQKVLPQEVAALLPASSPETPSHTVVVATAWDTKIECKTDPQNEDSIHDENIGVAEPHAFPDAPWHIPSLQGMTATAEVASASNFLRTPSPGLSATASVAGADVSPVEMEAEAASPSILTAPVAGASISPDPNKGDDSYNPHLQNNQFPPPNQTPSTAVVATALDIK